MFEMYVRGTLTPDQLETIDYFRELDDERQRQVRRTVAEHLSFLANSESLITPAADLFEVRTDQGSYSVNVTHDYSGPTPSLFFM